MNLSLRKSTFALVLLVSAMPFLALHAEAKSTFMADCSAKYKAAKAAGTVDAATKWTDFMKTQCAAAPADQAAAPDPAVTTAKATTPLETTTTPSGSFMQNCSASWKAMKAANTVPEGLTWKTFIAAKCVTPAAAKVPAATMAKASTTNTPFMEKCATDWKAMKVANTVPDGLTWKAFVIGKCVAKPAGAMAKTADATNQTFIQKCATDWKAMKAANAVPAGLTWKEFVVGKCVVDGASAPAATPVVAKKKQAAPPEPTTADPGVKLVDKNGKPFTAGQLAAHERARTCGAKWRAEKEAGTLQAGMKWPQYWSKCNAEIKAAAALQ